MSKVLTIHHDSKPIYDIVIENGFQALCGHFNKLSVKGKKLCIVTDSNVGPLYAACVQKVLEETGNQVFVYTFPAGEENKNLDVVENVYEFLIQNHFDRTDMLVALGGGVVGDLTGFTAATYLRGIAFIQVPTSLLAMADSSIGGKTGVDFRSYKNMVGAFYQPRLVYMNIKALDSLSERLFNSGLGEIIKHGLIKDMGYYDFLCRNREAIMRHEENTIAKMIHGSCVIKKNVVEPDPTEKGDRALLNFGHTLGHAVEKLSDFKLYHGECVVLGMIAALKLSLNRGQITENDYVNARKMFAEYGFPTKVSGMTAEQIVEVSKNDKKMVSGKVKFILLNGTGNAVIDTTVTDEEMKETLREIL